MIEQKLVSWILNTLPTSPLSLIGNGDDAAVLNTVNKPTLIATDMLLDGTHFRSEQAAPELIGRKAVAVNFSDIAAMGGWPSGVFISFAAPKNTNASWLRRVLQGAQDMARAYDCGIDGGDTNSWDGKFVINICVTGIPHWRGPVTRKGAQPGDAIMVTGSSLGGSLQSGHHANFTPRLLEARWILDRHPIHSMIDISDGLSTDARHLASASSQKIVLRTDSITSAAPFTDEFKSVFCDGEDFELLFSCSESTSERLLKEFPWPCGIRRIGSVVPGEGVFLITGRAQRLSPLEFSGYEH